MSTDLPSFSFDPQPVAETLPHVRSIGGFWRRFFAFFLDSLILGIIGIVIGAIFFDTLSDLGAWGRLLGFLIAVPYFAVMESSVGGGQSLGKRLLKLKVVDAKGNTLTFEWSFIRYSVFALPYFLNGLALPITKTPWMVIVLLGTIIFGIGGSTFYLLIFNRSTRQGLHDLAVGSYVVRAVGTGPVVSNTFWKFHWAVVGTLLVLSVVGGGVSYQLSKSGFFPELWQDLQLVEQMDGVRSGNALVSWSHSASGESTKRTLIIRINYSQKAWSPEAMADQAVMLILQNDKNVQDYDLLQIVITRGYDLGIAHGSFTWKFEHTLADWNQRLFGASPEQISPPAQQ